MGIKITLIGGRISSNLGCPSMLISTMKALSIYFPNAEYSALVPGASYRADSVIAPRYKINVFPLYEGNALLFHTLFYKFTRILTGPESVKTTIDIMDRSDVIIDIRGIIFLGTGPRTHWNRYLLGNSLRGFKSGLNEFLRFMVPWLLKKPVIKYTSSLGPFSLKWSRIFSRMYFGRFIKLIMARENESFREIKSLRVNTPMITVPDTAFLLPANESVMSSHYNSLHSNNPLIGISVSFQPLIRASTIDYCQIMADLAINLIDKYKAYIVLIPNQLEKGPHDDRKVAEIILSKIQSPNCEIIDTEPMLAQELKFVIRQCDSIIASRYHTIIAALSQNIPVMIVGWHYKYNGVLRLFKQEQWIINVKDLTSTAIIKKFKIFWDHQDEIRQSISEILPGIFSQVENGAKEVYNIITANFMK